MVRQRVSDDESQPPCYAMVLPGLEAVASDEITRDLGGEIKRTARGLLVFRVPQISSELLRLRTVEDVFLFAWGTDKLTYRAQDLKSITRWTDRDAPWDALLRLHHAVRPRPQGKPTLRVVAQMEGKHAYRRVDARKALLKGLEGKLPASWRHVDENASHEIWLTITGTTAVCGLRLSDRTMRHRTYKQEHLAASLRPTMAAAMVRLAELLPGQTILDPMCGAGTLLAEALTSARMRRLENVQVWGGDAERTAVRAAADNLRRLGDVFLSRWDAAELPLPAASVERILSNPPFGKQLGDPETIGTLYRLIVREYDRILKPRGRAVLLVSNAPALKQAAEEVNWKSLRQLRVRILGQPATISIWRKP